MNPRDDRPFFVILLVAFVLVTGAFLWNMFRLERDLLSLRREISTQNARLSTLMERPPSVNPAPSPVDSAPRISNERVIEETIPTQASAPEQRPATTGVAPSERDEGMSSGQQVRQLQQESTRLATEYQELQSRVQFLQDQLVIVDSNGAQLKAQRLAQIDSQDQALRDRINQLEETNRRLKSQLLTLQSFSPGWPNTFQTTLTELSLQQQVSQGEQEVAQLNAQRQELARIRLDRQLNPEPEVVQARSEWERELASTQMRLVEKEQEVLAARDRLAQAQRSQEEIEREREAGNGGLSQTPSSPAE